MGNSYGQAVPIAAMAALTSAWILVARGRPVAVMRSARAAETPAIVSCVPRASQIAMLLVFAPNGPAGEEKPVER